MNQPSLDLIASSSARDGSYQARNSLRTGAEAASFLSPRTSSALRSLRVVFATGPACFQAPGGGEVQLLETAHALTELGIRVSLFNPWQDRLGQADILHLFGTLPANLELAQAARKAGLPVVLSTVSWYDLRSTIQSAESWPERLKAAGGHLAKRCCPALPTWRRRLLLMCDLVLPNSAAEAHQLMRLYGIDPGRIRVVPNGVHDRFASGSAGMFEERFGLRDFVLMPGRIEPRKNQLGLIRALRGSGLGVVILGDPVPGHEQYASQCRREADPQTHFLGRIEPDDPLLPAAYAACNTLALPSFYETPGLAALEAALTGCKIVITDIGCAREYFGPHARYVNPRSLRDIRRAVLQAASDQPETNLATRVRTHFLWSRVAQMLGAIYGELLG